MKKVFILFVTALLVLTISNISFAVDEATVIQIQNDAAEAKGKADKNASDIESMKGGLPALQSQIIDIQSQIDEIQLTPGPEGPQGDQGPPGTCVCPISQQDYEQLQYKIEILEQEIFYCEDQDSDGYGIGPGCLGLDCDDSEASVNPGTNEICNDLLDNDCDELTDCSDTDCDNDPICASEPPPHEPCDGALPLDSSNAFDAAKAIGLCEEVAVAQWVLPDAQTSETLNELGHGILSGFGFNVYPTEGDQLLALSTGTARNPTDPGFVSPEGYDAGYVSGTAHGYPQESPSCPGVVTGEPHDGIGLLLEINVPSYAKGFSFNINMYTYEFPGYICSTYNDFFAVILSPAPAASINGSIVFDSIGNPVSVNSGFLEVCTPQVAGGKTFPCSLGPTELNGTGFEGHGATGWLEVKAPATPGTTITILFTTWDSGDGNFDTTTLIDNWQWLTDDINLGTGPLP